MNKPEFAADISTYNNPAAFLEGSGKPGGCDIALLDVCMPEMSGIELARELRRGKAATQFIFLTTSDEFAVEAFALKAVHYLLKPFTQRQFDEAMNRAILNFADSGKKFLPVKPEGGGVKMVNTDTLLYIESYGHALSVHIKSGVISEGRRSLSRMAQELEKLSPGQFVSPYKGYIVNLREIKIINVSSIILHSGDSIPIPKRSYKQIRNTYFDYIFSDRNMKGGMIS